MFSPDSDVITPALKVGACAKAVRTNGAARAADPAVQAAERRNRRRERPFEFFSIEFLPDIFSMIALRQMGPRSGLAPCSCSRVRRPAHAQGGRAGPIRLALTTPSGDVVL